MNKFSKYISFALLFLSASGCAQPKGGAEEMNSRNALFKQYAYLLQQSLEYTDSNNEVLPAIQKFIDTTREYDFKTNSRMEPVILQPLLFNTNKQKILIMVLERTIEGKNDPAEYVKFVYADKRSNRWEFTLKKGYTRSFSYAFGHPVLSDQEITLRVLRDLIDAGYMDSKGYQIHDEFFKDEW